MKRLILTLIIACTLATGCGMGASDYEDAVLDGVSNLNRNQPEQALADFNRAIGLEPEMYDGYLGRANAFQTLGHYEEALQDYDRAIEIDPENANAYINRGSAHSHLGRYEKAIADYEKGLELDPEIDDPPGFIQRLFSNEPNTDKGIRKHLEYLKQQVKNRSG